MKKVLFLHPENTPKNMEENTPITLKDWADEDKPRERLMAQGKKNLSDAELLAILLGSGSRGESAVSLAQRLLASADNDLNKLRHHGIKELMQFKGMGEAKAISVVAALELGYRLISQQGDKKNIIVGNSIDLFEYIAPSIIDLPHAEFWVIFLNIRNKILGKRIVSKGGATETAVDVRTIFAMALESEATAIAVAHNHPSGSVHPSEKDRQLTERIYQAGQLMRIPLLEHLVVGLDDNGRQHYYSFHDHGEL